MRKNRVEHLVDRLRLGALILILLVPLAISQTASTGMIGDFGSAINSPIDTQPTEDFASLEGRVADFTNSGPLNKAYLTLRRIDATPAPGDLLITYSTATDSAGKFAMKDIEPGKYQLSASRNGFVDMEYGARGPNRAGTTLSLTRAQNLKGVNIRLIPQGVVSGRVLDEDGEPMADVSVQMQSYQYFHGKRQLTPAYANRTNDLGEFRIFGLPLGKYYLSANYDGNLDLPSVDRSAKPRPDEDYVPTYYPGTIDPTRAVQLEITPAGHLSSLVLSLSKARTFRISGRITNLVSAAGPTPLIMLTQRGPAFSAILNRPYQVNRTGQFEIRGVSPGSYWLTAGFSRGDREYLVRQSLDVGTSNIENVMLSIGEGGKIMGRTRVDRGTTENLAGITVIAEPRDPGITTRSARSTLRDDGSFELDNVPPDRYDLLFPDITEDVYVKSVRSGDIDVLSSGLELANGRLVEVEVVLSSGAGQITGIVQNSSTQQLAEGVGVVLLPEEKERQGRESYYKTGTTDQAGAFTLKGIVPGEYKLFAWEDLEPGAYMDPDFLKPIESKGEAITIREGDRKAVSIKMILADTTDASNKAPEVPKN